MTLEDSTNRRRYLNTRATLATLLDLGTVPIVNENDTVATDEIRFGDNDRLAAQIAVTIEADLLVLLSDVDGLYTANPQTDKAAKRLSEIQTITPEIEAMAGDAGSGLSKGGMKTKVMAAKTATSSGCAMIITEGSVLRPLHALENGSNATTFVAQGDPYTARKRWIGTMKPKGDITVDTGAAKALSQGKSLLSAGITDVSGKFGRGDPVTLRDPNGLHLGQGLIRYTSSETEAIKGQRSDAIESILGYPARTALIHRDDLAI